MRTITATVDVPWPKGKLTLAKLELHAWVMREVLSCRAYGALSLSHSVMKWTRSMKVSSSTSMWTV